MALTKPRAHQLFDIDYKQAVRALANNNINLIGGAPSTIDDVELSLRDRVLVVGQDTASENGLYYVTTLGTGETGTWTRSQDAAVTGELLAGAIVMVTEGTEYADTQWKLVSDNPIVIGTTPLTWEQNFGTAFAFANVFANGTAILADADNDALILTAGNNIEIVGNAESNSVTIGVTGISLNSIANGNSSVTIDTANGNVNVNVAGTVVTSFTATDSNFTGNILPTANVTYDIGSETERWRDIWLSNSTIYLGNSQISANATSLVITNPQGGQTVFSGETPALSVETLLVSGNINAVGNISGDYLLGNGSQLTGIQAGAVTTFSSTPPENPSQGDIWIDADTGIQYIYFNDGNSSQWAEMCAEKAFNTAGLSTNIRQTFTATENQTVFSISGGYTANLLDVYLNGVKLVNGVDVDISSGTVVELTVGADAGDSLDVVGYSSISSVTFADLSAVTQSIIPAANVTYDLGTDSLRWRDLYLSGNTINLGGATITTDAGSGAIALIPEPTTDNPNPLGVVITPLGGLVPVTTQGGNVTANAIANAAASPTAAPVPIDITTTPPQNGQALIWDNTGNVFVPGNVAAGGGNVVITQESFIATGNQTTFNITGGYTANLAQVYLNGVKLVNGVDVNVASGTNVVLTVGAIANSVVDVVAYTAVTVDNVYTIAQADAKFATIANTYTQAQANATFATIANTYTQTQTNELLNQKASTGKAIAMAIVFGG
jgi:hypothetical protein